MREIEVEKNIIDEIEENLMEYIRDGSTMLEDRISIAEVIAKLEVLKMHLVVRG